MNDARSFDNRAIYVEIMYQIWAKKDYLIIFAYILCAHKNTCIHMIFDKEINLPHAPP